MTYVPKREAWAHQTKVLHDCEGKEFWAFLLSMRTGKTKVTLDDFGRLWDQGEVDDLLVIAPAGVYRTWVNAIEDHVGEPLASDLKIYVWQSGAKSKVEQTRLGFFMGYRGPRVLLINVECLSKVKAARDLVLQFCQQRRVYLAIDESTSIKNCRSKRGKFVVKEVAPLCKVRRILTGLINPRDPSDVYNQFEVLKEKCLGFSCLESFMARYAIMAKSYAMRHKKDASQGFVKIEGWRDQDELAERIARYSSRVKLSDCYDLPPKLYTIRQVEMTDEQERIYRELKTYCTSQLSESVHVTATQACTVALRLHQTLCGHVGDEQGVRREIPTNRPQALLDLLEEWDDGESKAIAWCAYDQDVRTVSQVLSEKYGPSSVARFWGGNRATREQEERSFKEDPGCRFMVATASAGGRGRTWMVADLVVYYSNDSNLEHREQSEERPQGIGKQKSVLYVDLVAVHPNGSNTVDYTILQCLRNKMTLAALLMGDGWREWII
jgi:SNF2 family DNA or RNA helicase